MKKTLLPMMAVSALALSSAAHAEGYVGLGIGATKLSADCAGTTSCDNSDKGFKLVGGYKLSPNLAGEVVYLDFGKAKASIADFGGIVQGEIKSTAIGAGVALSSQFAPEWSGVARLGVARVKAKVTASLGAQSNSESDNTTQAYFGLGVGYAVSKTVSIDVSADFSKAKFSGDSGNLSMIGVGVTFSF